MSRRGLTILGLGVAGGAGYYLYSAGGDPKVAQKKAEADAAKVSNELQSQLPGNKKEAEKKGEEYASRIGSKFDDASADAKAKLSDAQKKADEYRQKTGKELNKAVDQFDKSVEEGAAKAKSGISSWFGGK